MYEFQNFYYAALAAIHLGFAWGLRNVWVALEQRRWALLGVAAVLLTLLGYAIFRVYEVLPALWWPGTREHFVERVGACAVSITLLVALTIPLRTKKMKPH